MTQKRFISLRPETDLPSIQATFARTNTPPVTGEAKSWYSIRNVSRSEAEIMIYDEIGFWGVTAAAFIADLKKIDAKDITVFINSPGGSVFDGLAIYNALRQHPANVEVTIMGVAASAASIIAMAGDTVVMPENAFMMIHNPLNMAYGNADDLREMADVLDKIGASLVGIYAKRTGLPEDEIKALLDAETWLNAEEAVLKGFADELQPELKVAASFDMERLPDNVRASIAPAAEPEDDHPLDTAAITAACAAAGLSAYADALALDPLLKTPSDVSAALTEAKEIVAVCQAGAMPEIAARLIAARVPLAAARTRIQQARVALDQATAVNHHIPKPTDAPQSAVSIAGIYAARRSTH